MRWKLLVITSLAAAVTGAVGGYAGLYLFHHFIEHYSRSAFVWDICGAALPIAVNLFAGIFVYRHTARRRKLQGFITMLVGFLLSLPLTGLIDTLFPIVHYVNF